MDGHNFVMDPNDTIQGIYFIFAYESNYLKMYL